MQPEALSLQPASAGPRHTPLSGSCYGQLLGVPKTPIQPSRNNQVPSMAAQPYFGQPSEREGGRGGASARQRGFWR